MNIYEESTLNFWIWVRTWILSVSSQDLDSVCLNSGPGFCLSQVSTWILSDRIQILTWDRQNPGPDIGQTESRSWLETERIQVLTDSFCLKSGPGFCLSQVRTWTLSVSSQDLDSVCLKSGPGFCLSQVRTWILSVSTQDLDSVCLKSGPRICLAQLSTQVLSWDRQIPGPDLRQTESRSWLGTDRSRVRT
jgi:predicted Rdx family selenoprotein